MRHQPARSLVNVQYRKNLAEYNAWEAQVRKDQAQAVAALTRRERRPIRLPRWVRIVVGIGIAAVGVWAFITLAFSFKG